GKRKIYIIDEVHMLTTAAFNALLKTLEEPPEHVFFIFATTEPQKLPATILSRCQRFDFRRIPVAQIQSHLSEVCQRDGITAEPGALTVIARAAEGGMRDALSLLDQVIAYSGGSVTVATARESVGLIGSQILFSVLKPTMARDPRTVVLAVTEAYRNGVDLRTLTHGLLEVLHAAILAKIGAPRETATEFSDEEWAEIHALAALRDLEEIELIYQILHHGLDSVARSPQPRLTLQVLLVKSAAADTIVRLTTTPGSEVIVPVRATAPISVSPAPNPPVVHAATNKPEVVAPRPLLTWDSFIQFVQTRRPMLASVLEHGQCPDFQARGLDAASPVSELPIQFPPGSTYYRDQLASRPLNEALHQFAAEFVSATGQPELNKKPRFRVELRDVAATDETPAERKNREHKEAEARAFAAAKAHPVIREAQALFGVETGPIELSSGATPSSTRQADV
ncbi:MAG: AAA family ATPase, partial [Bdellovibrionota bacterium]